MIFRKACMADADAIMEIIDYARHRMWQEGKHQWDETYPLRTHIEADMQQGNAYVMCRAGRVVAYGAVAFGEEPAYRRLLDGEWKSDLSYVVLHRLAVAGTERRQGVGEAFMREVERLMQMHGVHSFRVDTNYDNGAMLHLFRKLHFDYCGTVGYDRGTRMAYEKLI